MVNLMTGFIATLEVSLNGSPTVSPTTQASWSGVPFALRFTSTIFDTVLQSRERREVDLALQILAENVERLRTSQTEMSPDDQKLAEYYLGRIANVQAFFRFAQLALESVVGQGNAIDFSAVTKIKIE